MDRRQNNNNKKQCPSGIAQRPPHHAIAVSIAMQNSHKDNVHSSAVGKQLKQKKSNSLSPAQLHFPALDLFWANLWVQLTSLLLISPAFLTNRCMVSQLCTWWQSIQTGARPVSDVPGGSPYKQVPGQSVTYLLAVHTDRCQVGQSPGLLQSPAGRLGCLRHAV